MKPQVAVPEPNAWREILSALDADRSLQGLRIAIQEYGKPNPDLVAGLEARGATVPRAPVYARALPEDTRPLSNSGRAELGYRVGAISRGRARLERVQRGGFVSQPDASGALDRAFERLRREEGVERSLTLGELVDEHLAQNDAEEVTIHKLRWLLGKAVAVFGDRRVGELFLARCRVARAAAAANDLVVAQTTPNDLVVAQTTHSPRLVKTRPFAGHFSP